MIEQLKEGYKKTEVGIIPNEWTPKTYGELFHFLTTSSFSRDQLSEEGDVRCVHYGDIHTKYHQFIDFQNGFNSFIDLENGKKYPFIKDGDIIMADASEDYSGIGKSVEVKNLGEQPAISGLHTFLLRDKNGVFVDGFRAYIHSMTPVKKRLDRLATGLKVYGVSKGNLKTVLVPVPPKPEQRAIATALSDVDTLITNLDKLIAKKKATKQGAMQRLLKSLAQGGQRLSGFEGEWVETTLGEICIKIQDGNYGESYPKSHEFLKNGVPFLTSKAIGKSGALNYALVDFISSEKHALLTKAHVQIEDVLFTNRGASVGAIGFVDKKIMNGNIGPQLTLLRANKEKIRPSFLFQIMKSDEVQKQISSNDSGSAMNFFGIRETAKFNIPLPKNIEEQLAICNVLSDMDKGIESLEITKSKYLHIKQGMMQELLTGKTRLV